MNNEWDLIPDTQMNILANRHNLSSVIVYSPHYGMFMEILSDNVSFLVHLSLEFPTQKELKNGNFPKLIFLTTDKGNLNKSKCPSGFSGVVNESFRSILIYGFLHYGYFKSYVLGGFAFYDEKLNGTISLHSALFKVAEKGVLIVAASGKGKSTYSFAFNKLPGYAFISDDWVRINDGIGFRGDNFLRVDKNSITKKQSGAAPRYSYHPCDNKFEIPIDNLTDLNCIDSTRITHIVILDDVNSNESDIVSRLGKASSVIPFNFSKKLNGLLIDKRVDRFVSKRHSSFEKLLTSCEVIVHNSSGYLVEESTDILSKYLFKSNHQHNQRV